MSLTLLNRCIKSKAMKISSGLAGGGGIIIVLLAFQGDYKERINKAEAATRLYVDQKYELLVKDTKYLKQGQDDIKDILKIIEKRLYELNIQNK